MLRLLTQTDYEAAIAIASLRSKHSGTTASLVPLLELMGKFPLGEDPKTKFIGYFDGDELISWMALRYGTLGEEKVWVILDLFTSRFRNYFSWSHPELGKLVAWAFQEAEDNGYFAYLYSVATRLERVYEMQWRKNPWLPPQGRYEKEVLARVPANTLHELAWLNRLANLPKPDDISVLKRTLKKEY